MRRSHLPLNGLRVFDAAARHLSFTRAADELAVTPAAVGQQIRALEDMLGVVLFRRTSKGLELTHEGEAGLEALRAGFLHFEEAVRAMRAGQSSHRIALAAPRDFTAKWLSARLASYAKAHPEIRFDLMSGYDPPDFTQANLDLAVIYAPGPGELEGVALGEGLMVTLGTGPAIRWAGGPEVEDSALRVGDAGLAIDAAIAGMGQTNVPALLAQADIVAGRLAAHGAPTPAARGYWLVAPLPQWRQKKVRDLVAALTTSDTVQT
ncbi:MAG: LysR family transcriptional regulator [Alphaproteobacteria bacterium]|nr:LysR family transcriptional regulator [Alphaproteobacteria bacterium]